MTERDTYSGLTIEAVTGGGYVVYDYNFQNNPNRLANIIFACSTQVELVDFINSRLLNTDVDKVVSK